MPSGPAYGSFENKIFEELSLHNPDLMKGNNPFTSESTDEMPENMMVPNEYLDNKLIDNFEGEIEPVPLSQQTTEEDLDDTIEMPTVVFSSQSVEEEAGNQNMEMFEHIESQPGLCSTEFVDVNALSKPAEIKQELGDYLI